MLTWEGQQIQSAALISEKLVVSLSKKTQLTF